MSTDMVKLETADVINAGITDFKITKQEFIDLYLEDLEDFLVKRLEALRAERDAIMVNSEKLRNKTLGILESARFFKKYLKFFGGDFVKLSLGYHDWTPDRKVGYHVPLRSSIFVNSFEVYKNVPQSDGSTHKEKLATVNLKLEPSDLSKRAAQCVEEHGILEARANELSHDVRNVQNTLSELQNTPQKLKNKLIRKLLASSEAGQVLLSRVKKFALNPVTLSEDE